MTIAQYSFLPWLRRGIANQVQIPAATSSRATLDVTLTIASDVETVPLPARRIQLVGPGDVIGISPQVVVRTEPRNWITDFEPNYLTFIEFYDEDFAWRYTPAIPDLGPHRLTPWITLLVLKEGEFTRNTSPARPLPSVTLKGVAANAVLPPDAQLWAWAHVHLNTALATPSPDLGRLGSLLRDDPDRGFCRLVNPRRLEPNTAYYAFVIPTFEVGRKAGLGETVADGDAGLALAWTVATEFPVYYDWFFRTGVAGDFEELVRALKPRPIDGRVGIRDLDVQQPGLLLPPITSAPDDAVGLEGAILSPSSKPKPLDPGSNFAPEIVRVVNLAADAEEAGPTAGDPVVTAPLYGRWHALVKRISADPLRRNWVNELNLDPRFRAVAGFGTRVIQQKQEEYMKLAWQQIGEILAANRKIHFGQVGMLASERAFQKHFVPLGDDRVLAMSAPVLNKVMGSPVTVRHLVARSQLPQAALSGAFRKQLRPRGAVARRIARAAPGAAPRPLSSALAQLNAGVISAAPPRTLPDGPTIEGLAGDPARPLPELLQVALANRRLLLLVALLVALLLLIAGPSSAARIAALLAGAAAVAGFAALGALARRRAATAAITPTALTAEAAQSAPPAPAFVLAVPGSPVPAAVAPAPAPGALPVDSPDAARFRQALVPFHALLSTRAIPPTPRAPLALAEVRSTVLRALEPTRTFPRRLGSTLRIGSQDLSAYLGAAYKDRDRVAPAERMVPVMAYPDIRRPMYEPLRDISSELLVPNLKLIEPNTISLMVRNQPFIEAYMVGLNHEFARELLWREFPTDQRPSTFRQFWDVSSVANTENLDPKAFEESLRDIVRIHEWPEASILGEHGNRTRPGDPPETAGTPLLERPVILVVRGDLLKRYPHTVIYAQRARWGERSDNALRLTLWDETGEKSGNDPADPNIRLPLYRAFVGPDVHFIGFDLSVGEVRGDPTLEETAAAKGRIPASKLGWFFVLKEVVGEPRFGLDEHAPTAPGDLKWDNLSWDNLGAGVTVIDLDQPFAPPPGGSDTEGVGWGTNAADLAFILYQKPVLVAVHGREMLRDLT